MATPEYTKADRLFNQVLPRGGQFGTGWVEQNSPSGVNYPSSHHQHKYHGTLDHRCTGMEAGGV